MEAVAESGAVPRGCSGGSALRLALLVPLLLCGASRPTAGSPTSPLDIQALKDMLVADMHDMVKAAVANQLSAAAKKEMDASQDRISANAGTARPSARAATPLLGTVSNNVSDTENSPESRQRRVLNGVS